MLALSNAAEMLQGDLLLSSNTFEGPGNWYQHKQLKQCSRVNDQDLLDDFAGCFYRNLTDVDLYCAVGKKELTWADSECLLFSLLFSASAFVRNGVSRYCGGRVLPRPMLPSESSSPDDR